MFICLIQKCHLLPVRCCLVHWIRYRLPPSYLSPYRQLIWFKWSLIIRIKFWCEIKGLFLKNRPWTGALFFVCEGIGSIFFFLIIYLILPSFTFRAGINTGQQETSLLLCEFCERSRFGKVSCNWIFEWHSLQHNIDIFYNSWKFLAI